MVEVSDSEKTDCYRHCGTEPRVFSPDTPFWTLWNIAAPWQENWPCCIEINGESYHQLQREQGQAQSYTTLLAGTLNPPLFYFMLSVSFMHAIDTQGSYTVHLGAGRRSRRWGEWWVGVMGSNATQLWASLWKGSGKPWVGLVLLRAGVGCVPERRWSAEGLPLNNSSQVRFLLF